MTENNPLVLPPGKSRKAKTENYILFVSALRHTLFITHFSFAVSYAGPYGENVRKGNSFTFTLMNLSVYHEPYYSFLKCPNRFLERTLLSVMDIRKHILAFGMNIQREIFWSETVSFFELPVEQVITISNSDGYPQTAL